MACLTDRTQKVIETLEWRHPWAVVHGVDGLVPNRIGNERRDVHDRATSPLSTRFAAGGADFQPVRRVFPACEQVRRRIAALREYREAARRGLGGALVYGSSNAAERSRWTMLRPLSWTTT